MENSHVILNWSDYEENIPNTFKQLFYYDNFTDVTLVSKDGHHVKAHKVVLSSLCKLLKTTLVNNLHPNPIIYIKNIKPCILDLIIKLLYLGMVEV